MQRSRLRVSNTDGITEIGFVDRNILDEANIQAIRDEIAGIIASVQTPRLVLNFQNVDHLSSAALGALIKIRQEVLDRKGQLRLAEIDPQIYEVFVITQLSTLFQIFPTAGEAKQSLKV